MANPYLGIVNRQLLFARYQLSQRVEESNSSDRLRNQGALYAAVWHLALAYRNYLAEVGANYKLTAPEQPADAAALCAALEAMNKGPAEARELERLEREGFIGVLLAARDSIETVAGDLVPPAPADVDDNPLRMVDISDRVEKVDFGFADLETWIGQFKDMLGRHRDHMIEY